MTAAELASRTRERLAARARRVAPEEVLVPRGTLIRAAVLIAIVDRGEPYLVFAKRTERVGTHKGQIGFPGGVVEAGDASFLDTALRECEEEVGLPRAAVEPLGVLDDTETVATRFVITPFVGLLTEPVTWRPDGEEIERVIEVPYAALVDPGNVRVETWTRDGVAREMYFFDYRGDTVWGATARILRDYLDLVAPSRTA
jgi:8-oxo-dGTP pyrophosphatase MutT (NUDIX family)